MESGGVDARPGQGAIQLNENCARKSVAPGHSFDGAASASATK